MFDIQKTVKSFKPSMGANQSHLLRRCDFYLRSTNAKSIYDEMDGVCWDCHRETPHGKVHSLSSAPNILRPENKLIIPE